VSTQTILEADGLKKYFDQNRSLLDIVRGRKTEKVQAVDDVSFSLGRNEVLGVIGESGCGKTTLLMTLLGLEDKTDGEIRLDGRRFDEFSESERREFHRTVQVVFQDPFDSLDPKKTVEQTLRIPLDVHDMDDQDRRIREALEMAELRPVERFLDQYPDNLSGGEKQRVSIARALVLEPDVILADEPVSMLDVSTQAAILELLSDLIEEEGLSMIYISHDLSTVSYICDWINVMYLGRIVEQAATMELLEDPKHPYTRALIDAIPVPNPHAERTRTQLGGSTPDPIGLGEGCRFADRCPERMDRCDQTPAFLEVAEGRSVACHLHYDHETYLETSEVVDPPESMETTGGSVRGTD
jgi:peptide/nickel transport system ATP-binding protein